MISFLVSLSLDRKSAKVITDALPVNVAIDSFRAMLKSGRAQDQAFPRLEVWTQDGTVRSHTFRPEKAQPQPAQPESVQAEPELEEEAPENTEPDQAPKKRGRPAKS